MSSKPMPKTCGETQLEILQAYAIEHNKTYYRNSMFIGSKDNIKKYAADKLPIQSIEHTRLEPFDLDEEEFALTDLTAKDLVDKLINTVNTDKIVGIDLAMGELSESYHCFILFKDGQNNESYLLTHTYFGEIDERVTVFFSFSKFQELLEGKEGTWKEIFGVDPYICECKYWNLIITEIS